MKKYETEEKMKNTKIFLQILFSVIFSLSLSDCTAKFTPPSEDIYTDTDLEMEIIPDDNQTDDVTQDDMNFYSIRTSSNQSTFTPSKQFNLNNGPSIGLKTIAKENTLFVLISTSVENQTKTVLLMDEWDLSVNPYQKRLSKFSEFPNHITEGPIDLGFSSFDDDITMELSRDGNSIYIFQIIGNYNDNWRNIRVYKYLISSHDFDSKAPIIFSLELSQRIQINLHGIISTKCENMYNLLLTEESKPFKYHGMSIDEDKLNQFFNITATPNRLHWADSTILLNTEGAEFAPDLACGNGNLLVSLIDNSDDSTSVKSKLGVFDQITFKNAF